MSSNTALLNWIKSPDRTKSELMDAHTEYSADGHLLDAIEAQLDMCCPHWNDKPKPVIRMRPLTEDEVMAQIDAAFEKVGETHGD